MAGVWHKSLIVLFLALFAGSVIFADEYSDSIDSLKSQLPPGTLPDSLSNVSLPVDKALDAVKSKCNKESGSDAAFEEATQAMTKAYECLSQLLNWNTLMDEVEAAKPTGDLEIVFNKYCRKRNTALDCVQNFTASLSPCLSEKENRDKKVLTDVVENLLNFVCHKDGDQIALFIAEKGPECFTEKKDGLVGCINATFGQYYPAEGADMENLEKHLPKEIPELTIGKDECEKMDELQVCIVRVLEKCEETTPANLVESAFKFIRNETPCANITTKFSVKKAGAAGGGADSTTKTFLPLVFLGATVALFLRGGRRELV